MCHIRRFIKKIRSTPFCRKQNKRKQVGLFFGSFNPVHVGHLRLAEHVYLHTDLDEIWFVVSPRNPMKTDDELLVEHLRKEMIELAVQDKKWLKVSDIEFDMPKPSYTVKTLFRLSNIHPNRQFILLIGSDNMRLFDRWKDFQKILDNFEVWVYPRRGYDIEQVTTRFPEMKLLKNTPYFDVSSTEIRNRIQKNQDVFDWLHPAVYQHVLENKLYK